MPALAPWPSKPEAFNVRVRTSSRTLDISGPLYALPSVCAELRQGEEWGAEERPHE